MAGEQEGAVERYKGRPVTPLPVQPEAIDQGVARRVLGGERIAFAQMHEDRCKQAGISFLYTVGRLIPAKDGGTAAAAMRAGGVVQKAAQHGVTQAADTGSRANVCAQLGALTGERKSRDMAMKMKLAHGTARCSGTIGCPVHLTSHRDAQRCLFAYGRENAGQASGRIE